MMGLGNTFDNPRFFAEFAGTSYSVWEKIIGCEVTHKMFGVGIIEEIANAKSSIHIKILFKDLPDSKLKRFSNISFMEGAFETINFDISLISGFAEFCEKMEQKERKRLVQEEQNRKEAKALQEFNELKQKYGLSASRFKSITSLLFIILIKVDSEETLEEDDIEWLMSNKVFEILAIHYEREYKRTGDLWNLVKTSSNLRKIKNADRVLQLLKDKHTNNSTLMSAILTTLGAAYRDINKVEEAEKCADQAIKNSNSSYHPYNLKGAICYQTGRAEEGDKYFDKAIKLGSDPRFMDREIENSLKTAGKNERISVANYLLNKDEQKYQWVKSYLGL